MLSAKFIADFTILSPQPDLALAMRKRYLVNFFKMIRFLDTLVGFFDHLSFMRATLLDQGI
jgi:hypothetical protein